MPINPSTLEEWISILTIAEEGEYTSYNDLELIRYQNMAVMGYYGARIVHLSKKEQDTLIMMQGLASAVTYANEEVLSRMMDTPDINALINNTLEANNET